MAHPIVEKLKTFGIRHGEKVGVAVVTALCLTMLAMAFSRPSIDITADQIASSTQQARQNIQEVQKDDNVVKTIQGQGIVQPNFVKVVDERKPGSADPARYQLSNVLSSPEPGAGLLRDQPELIRVSRVEAHPGRGSIRLVVLDSQGRVQYEEPEKTTTKPKAKRKRRSSSSGSGGQARMMMGGGYGTGSGQEETEREKTDRLKKEKADRDRLSKSLTAGATIPAPSKKEEEAAPVAASRDYKTELKGFRWVALTGVVDHKQLRDNYARALKVDFAAAIPTTFTSISSASIASTTASGASGSRSTDRTSRTKSWAFSMRPSPRTAPTAGRLRRKKSGSRSSSIRFPSSKLATGSAYTTPTCSTRSR
jgi:hypothetical protein